MKKRIGWVLNGNHNLASSRLQGYRIHEYFCYFGLDSEIAATDSGRLKNVYSYNFFRLLNKLLRARYDVVFFQKPEWIMFKLSEILRLNGIRTAAIQCDPFSGDYETYFDRVILTTQELRETLGVLEARIIDDMIEVPPDLFKKDYTRKGKKLRLVWTGQGMARYVKDFFNELSRHPLLSARIEVVTIGPEEWATVKWELDTVYENILSCDVAVIPLPDSQRAVTKSTNRLTQFMALGMPTIASPINSYVRLFQRGAPFVIARDVDDFARSILTLDSVDSRAKLGNAARDFAWTHFSPDSIGPLWIDEANQLLTSQASPRKTAKAHTLLIGKALGAFSRLGNPSYQQRKGVARSRETGGMQNW